VQSQTAGVQSQTVSVQRQPGDARTVHGRRVPAGRVFNDMLGNVWELCADWKAPYPPRSVTDPTGPASGYYRVSRGGGWFDTASAVHATFRSSPKPGYRGNSLGFRLARGPV
jgi:formylglycine-generating enzyme required for sulfatase activity